MIAHKNRSFTYRTIGLLGLLLVASVWANDPAPNQPASSQEAQDINAPTEKSKQDPNIRRLLTNPFQYRIPQETGGFVPSLQTEIPAGIKVLAIMVVAGQKPLAVLKVPGMIDVFYVHAGDIIGVEDTTSRISQHKPSNTTRQAHTTKSTIVYLNIEDITSQQVVLYPQANPAGKQILR